MPSSDKNFASSFIIESPNSYIDKERNCRVSKLNYEDTKVSFDGTNIVVHPYCQQYAFETDLKVPKTGLMLVGMGGNNGSTLVATLAAHRHKLKWRTRWGEQTPNYIGSLVLSSTLRLGRKDTMNRSSEKKEPILGHVEDKMFSLENNQEMASSFGCDIYAPFSSFLPLINPSEMPISGWDISSFSLSQAIRRACVLEPDLQVQLEPLIGDIVPLPGAYDPDFIALNQGSRADHIILGGKKEILKKLRADIQAFRLTFALDQVIVLWTANTERFSSFSLNANAEELLAAIEEGNDSEIAPSVLYAVAAILEGAAFINGSPQNTLLPAVVDLAMKRGVKVAGDDFKSGQTKLKSVLVDFLISAGIKPISIASYNHLGTFYYLLFCLLFITLFIL